MLRPVAFIGEDAPQCVIIGDEDVAHFRSDDEFNRSECDHHPGHAGYAALGMIDVIAVSSSFLIGEAVLQDFLILGNERGFLQTSPAFRLIE